VISFTARPFFPLEEGPRHALSRKLAYVAQKEGEIYEVQRSVLEGLHSERLVDNQLW
jgi:hypothetical protein